MNKNKLYATVGKNIKKYRILYNTNNQMSQEQLAEAVGVSSSLISKLESSLCDKGVSITTLYKISIVLNIPIQKFMEDNNDKS